MWGRSSENLQRLECSSAPKVSAPARKVCGSVFGAHADGHQRPFRPRQRAGRRVQHRARAVVEEAIEWASRQARVLGDIDDWPAVTEARGIGMAEAASHAALYGSAEGHCRDGGRRGAVYRTTGRELSRLIEETARYGRAPRDGDHALQREGGATEFPRGRSACSTARSSSPRS